MSDPVQHVVVDANTLSAFLHPQSTNSVPLQDASRILLGAVLHGNWPGIRLYSPAICIAEALAVLDKYRFCTWHGPVKSDPSKRLSAADYTQARDSLTNAVRSRRIEQLEHEPNHVLLAGLVSPVNNMYQIRRRRRNSPSGNARVKSPMGATDCLIAGMTVHLVSRMGRDAVVLATGDQRLCDVVAKAGRVKVRQAERLGLITIAQEAGLIWRPHLYPRVVNLHRSTLAALRSTFGGWPLPTVVLTFKRRQDLTSQEATTLMATWVTVASEYAVSDPDNLPYSPLLDDLKTRFAVASGVYLSNECVFRHLLQRRKAGELHRP